MFYSWCSFCVAHLTIVYFSCYHLSEAKSEYNKDGFCEKVRLSQGNGHGPTKTQIKCSVSQKAGESESGFIVEKAKRQTKRMVYKNVSHKIMKGTLTNEKIKN